MLKIVEEKTVYDNHIVISEAEIINNEGEKFSRLYVKRQDAAVVLIINTESNTVVLTKQFRCAITSKTKERILEIVAGVVEEHEDPLETAIREAEEESGYKIKPENITPILSCFTSPGLSSERFFLFHATVTNEDKVSKGGGLIQENEYIEVIEMDIEEFKEQIRNRKIEDAKTYIAGLYLMTL